MMLQCLRKECLRCRDSTCSTQTELHGVAWSIHGAVQIHQLAPNLDERFINPPTPTHQSLSLVRPAGSETTRVQNEVSRTINGISEIV